MVGNFLTKKYSQFSLNYLKNFRFNVLSAVNEIKFTKLFDSRKPYRSESATEVLRMSSVFIYICNMKL